MTKQDRKKLDQISNIAHKIRKGFESMSGLLNLTLCGYCARASVQLHIACEEHGIKVGLEQTDRHMFNTFAGHIVDITATQFDVSLPPVVVKEILEKADLDRWHRWTKSHASVKSVTDQEVFGATESTVKSDRKKILHYM